MRNSQRVAIGIGVIAQHWNCDGGVFQNGQGVVVGNRGVVHGRDGDVHIALNRRIAIGDGVGEIDGAVVVGGGREFQLAVCGEAHDALG